VNRAVSCALNALTSVTIDGCRATNNDSRQCFEFASSSATKVGSAAE